MRLRDKTYERCGTYLLLRKIESDALSETWRVRDVSSDPASEPLVLRRFPAIPAEGMNDAAARASAILPHLRGPSIARQQRIGNADGSAFLVHEHEGGRSLALIADRARNGKAGRHPIPTDLALTIAEKIALALGATHELKHEGSRAIHGGLLPHYVWITGDGDVRLAGQELGRAMPLALANERTAPLVRPFLAPEVVLGGPPSVASDVYSAGALLYLLLTGEAPPECRTAGQNIDRVQRGRSCLSGDPLPTELQTILIRCLASDPAMRYGSATELRDAISKILHDGTSAPTTFNLAFYLHSLLRRDLEQERIERESEDRVNAARSRSVRLRGSSAKKLDPSSSRRGKKSRLLVAATVFLVLASGITAAYLKLAPVNTPVVNNVSTAPIATAPPVPAETMPVADVIAEQPATTDAAPLLDDEAAREVAFEAAVNARLQQEMIKLQARHDEEMRRERRTSPIPRPPAATPSPAPTSQAPPVLSPEELEPRRDEAVREASVTSTPAPTPVPPASSSAPASLAREGQLIELARVDEAPAIVRSVQPVYPPLAQSRKIEGSVIVSALVSETGRVLEVRVMRGDQRKMGLDEAAVAAVRGWQFTPAMKDGQRVRTWMPVAVSFKVPK